MQPRKPHRPLQTVNNLVERYSMLGQLTRDSFIARNVPTREHKTVGKLGASGIAMPWTGAKKRTSRF
ncbi:MAG: hypothetical protein ABIF01_02825 [Candidatus Micrarchaeota archaeon]